MADVAKGNLESSRFLFDRYHLRIFNFVFQMCRDRGLSEDLTQEAFYKVLKNRTSYKGGNFASWIYTIARNNVHTHFRKQKNMQEDDLDGVLYKLSDEPSDVSENAAFLQRALQRLEPDDREVLVMHKMQGIKYEELGTILEISPGAAKAKAYRALKKLKEIYFQKL